MYFMNKIYDIKSKIKLEDEIEKILFKCVNENDYDTLKYMIKEYKTFNYNISDEKNVYLIEYLIILNKPDILKLIFDNDNTNIFNFDTIPMLELIIKFSYIEIMKLLIEKNKKMIGFNLFETFNEKNELPLFYAITYKNMTFIKLILEAMNNIYLKNKKGNNALHQVIVDNYDIEIVKLIGSFLKNKNIYNDEGNTALMLAIQYKKHDVIVYLLENNVDLYLKNVRNGFSILNYIILSNDEKIVKIFDTKKKELKILVNNQDISGNIYFHYFVNNINERNEKINEIFFYFCVELEPNYNVQNIDGNTPLHLIFDKVKNFEYQNIIKFLIKETNINIQNNLGFSSFFLMIIHKIYAIYEEELKCKKINIFMFNYKRNTIFNYIKQGTDAYVKLLTLIIDSYVNNIDKNKIYYDYWDNKYIFNFKNLNEKDNLELKKMDVIITSDYKKMFKEIIKYKLEKNINFFISNNIILNTMYSYPKITVYPELIVGYKNILITTYTPDIINIFFGLLYINKNFKNVATVLNILDLKNDIVHYDILSIKNFQLLWKNYKLLNVFENLSEKIKRFIEENYTHFILTIGIEIYANDLYQGHSNILIFDFKNKIVERFEPYGQEPNFFKYDDMLLDTTLSNFVKSLQLNFKYVSPKDYALKIGFQTLEVHETETYIGDPDGYCSAWCLFWACMKIAHPNIESKKLFILIIREVMNKGITYKSLIRFFCSGITELRDIFFKNIDTNINDWTNEQTSIEQLHKLNKLLIIELGQYQ